MSLRLTLLCTALVGAGLTAPAVAKPVIGEPAPAFALGGADGRTHALADYRGKVVVLEWNNPQCPFVKKHYGAGNLPKQQADAVSGGAVWLTINSAAPGKQGELDAATAKSWIAETRAMPSAYLFDPTGSAGHAYGAKTTPHLYVIDAAGVLRYAGGIDSIASADVEDIAKATQYVPQVLGELAAGKTVSVTTSEPYGCSVKYGG
jgi:hypothetical protein